MKDMVGKPSLDFPILKEPRVWRLYAIKDQETNIFMSDGFKTTCCVVLVFRHYFLVQVMIRIFSNLVRLRYGFRLTLKDSEPVLSIVGFALHDRVDQKSVNFQGHKEGSQK
jgi:hypothetical protein